MNTRRKALLRIASSIAAIAGANTNVLANTKTLPEITVYHSPD